LASSGVVTRAARAERRDLVLEALDRLEEIDREILVLRGVEQRGNAETAAMLDLAPSTAAMRYRRALERLRTELPDAVFHELEEG
jgi:RNA polymerase sigma-70 factor (ECF subfamily)